MRPTQGILGLLLVLEGARAQYHHHRRGFSLRHGHGHHQRDKVGPRDASSAAGSEAQTVTVTDNSRSDTTTIPEIVVFTDGGGNPVSTATAVLELVPSANTDVSVAKDSSDIQDANSSITHVSRATGNGLFGVSYAPYNADGSCKSASQIKADFGVLGSTYYLVRVYGVDCGQVPNVYAAAKANNLVVMWGIYSLDDLGDQIATLTKGVNKDWSHTDTISIGNELVNNGQATPSQVLDAIASAKKLLASAGYTGPVVTVDTFVAALANIQLCKPPSDYCAVNIHPFFDPNTPADQAGVFVANQVQNLRNKLGDSSARIRVCESGWPWQGSANGKAIPGVDQQTAALSSIKKAFASSAADMVLFSAFNDRWKTAAAATFYAEQYWGMGTADAPSA